MVTMTRDELLVVLMEECAEVIKAASKCLRFGYDTTGPGDYGRNSVHLATEVGDVLGVLDALPLDSNCVFNARRTKLARAYRAKCAHASRGAS